MLIPESAIKTLTFKNVVIYKGKKDVCVMPYYVKQLLLGL